jgi:uncharacterized protein (TIGR02145 family)
MVRKIGLLTLIILIVSFEEALAQGIKIGNQQWMAKNLDVSKFRNGEDILEVKSHEEWSNALKTETPAFCYYNFNKENSIKFGKLYNWHAVIDYRGLAPQGWKIPSPEDFENLLFFLGRESGIDLKHINWLNEIYGNSENIKQIHPGFNAMPGGFKSPAGGFGLVNESATIWTCALENSYHVYCFTIDKLTGGFESCCDGFGVSGGASVRCIRE